MRIHFRILPRGRTDRTLTRPPLLALRNRRGAFAVMFGIFFLTFMMFAAVAIDFSRLFVAKNELQTAADAGAVAAARQLLDDPSQTPLAAKRQIALNAVLGAAVDSSSAVLVPGVWNDEASVFTEVGSWLSADAVQVTVRERATYHIARLFGGDRDGDVAATAIAWSGASVRTTDDCVKPWAIPYTKLTSAIDPIKDPERDLDHEDRRRVQELVASGENQSALSFTLKQGTGPPADNPGNFYNVVLPVRCTADSRTCEAAQPGANVYYDNIHNEDDARGCSNHKISVGDVLETQPGVTPQQTINRAGDFCEAQGLARSCAGATIKAAFWVPVTPETMDWTSAAGMRYSQEDKRAGRFPVQIKINGSFVITGLSTDNSTPGSPKSQIQGYFTMVDDGGNIGRSVTLLMRPILVR